ncbi:endonuclease family protein-like protein [Coleophoma crateriformis]|uniref:Endonuclease family protein-like protein n=1 Tax=Coleophoma crateriformis TaxID=565419 RepID=A0A3D8QUM7_9HELO|nr:endonuclease family protein-like protein [Coleophoma crateriformis]
MARDESLTVSQPGIRITLSVSQEEAPLAESMPVRLITHNIRYATKSPFKGEERWPVRCPRLCSELVFHSTNPRSTFICLQEVLHSQLMDIHTALNADEPESWAYIGVGRNDGKQAGEYSPIFYRPSVWALVNWKTYWLSETPWQPSKGWDASSIRIVTLGVFTHRGTKHTVVVMSTHLDNDGALSRKKSAELILGIAQRYQMSWRPATILLGGDFNSQPDDGAYQVMTSEFSMMEDIGAVIPKGKLYGNTMTFTGFGYVDKTPTRIDFIFSQKGENLTLKTYGVLANRFDDGVYLSDHRACVADLELLPSFYRD